MRVSTQATGPASVDLAWSRYADPAQWTTWAPHLRRVEVEPTGVEASGRAERRAGEVDGRRLRVGLRGVVRGPLGVSVRFVVTAVDEEARTWSWTVRSQGITLLLDHTLVEVQQGTRAGLSISGPAPVVLAYRPVARRALTGLVRGA